MSVSVNTYYQGDLVNVTTGPGFLDEEGAAIDPTVLTLTIGRRGGPGNTIYTYGIGSTIAKVSVGNYDANIDTTLFVPDAYWYKWVGTGSAQAVNEGTFVLLPVDV